MPAIPVLLGRLPLEETLRLDPDQCPQSKGLFPPLQLDLKTESRGLGVGRDLVHLPAELPPARVPSPPRLRTGLVLGPWNWIMKISLFQPERGSGRPAATVILGDRRERACRL